MFLLFINDISNFAVEACVVNISNWYSMDQLCIYKNKLNVMVIGSQWQSKSLNLDDLDDFTISLDSDKLFLARQARNLDLWVGNDLSWDDHILELCRKMSYYFHMFRRLRKFSHLPYFSTYRRLLYNQR